MLSSQAKSGKKEKILKMYKESIITTAGVSEVSLKDIKALNPSEFVLVDVRSKKEQQTSMIPGAIPLKEFEASMGKYKGKKVITYCTIGYRSSRYSKTLFKKGFRVFNLKGSLLGWVSSGGDLVNKAGLSTKKVHVYSSKWNLLPSGFEGVW